MAVADASVIAKWFLVETHRDDALRLRDDLVGGKLSLASPAVMPFEVMNAVRFSRKSMEASRLKSVGKSLSLYGIALYHLKGDYLDLSIEVSSRNNVTTCDGSYVSLAQQLDSVLYTADEELLESLTPEDMKHVKHIAEYVSPRPADEASAEI